MEICRVYQNVGLEDNRVAVGAWNATCCSHVHQETMLKLPLCTYILVHFTPKLISTLASKELSPKTFVPQVTSPNWSTTSHSVQLFPTLVKTLFKSIS